MHDLTRTTAAHRRTAAARARSAAALNVLAPGAPHRFGADADPIWTGVPGADGSALRYAATAFAGPWWAARHIAAVDGAPITVRGLSRGDVAEGLAAAEEALAAELERLAAEH